MFEEQIFKRAFGIPNKKEYFCNNKSHHASQRCVPRWDFALYKGGMDYDKQPINVEEQVALLQNKGLIIEEATIAKSTSTCLDNSNPKAYQTVPSVMHFTIYGANYNSLYGSKKLSAQIVCRISQY